MPVARSRKAERERMGGPGNDRELPVGMGKRLVEVEKVVERCNPVVLPADQKNWREHLLGIDEREIGRHIEVGAGRDRVAERHFRIGQCVRDCGIAGARLSRVMMLLIMSRPRGRR